LAKINQKITPCLWFNKNCEEAINFYISVFSGSPYKKEDSKIISIQRYEEGMETPGIAEMKAKILTAVFELEGQSFLALDGGPVFKFNESTSFQVECENQEEVDYFNGKLSAISEAEICGWLKDKYGLSWQIIPRQLIEMLSDPEKKKVIKVMNIMLKMKKIIVKDLEKAYQED